MPGENPKLERKLAEQDRRIHVGKVIRCINGYRVLFQHLASDYSDWCSCDYSQATRPALCEPMLGIA